MAALPLIGPVLAVLFGHQARREVDANPELYSDDLRRVGGILGWVGIVLATMALLTVIGVALIFLPV